MRPYFLYGTAWKEDDTARCVFDALTSGFRAIDTANQRRHYHEAAVGEGVKRFLSKSGLAREAIFLQSKYTFARGQDHRKPYDENASIATQVKQSLESSLQHLQTDYLDSLVLHGPWNGQGISPFDVEAWGAMEALVKAGKVRSIGASNCSLEQIKSLHAQATIKPSYLQNRCFARTRWDQSIRTFCRDNNILYQGFSLLTANIDYIVLPVVEEIARAAQKSLAQVVFRFTQQIGMLPLTGTQDAAHMREDLDIEDFELPASAVATLENIAF